MPVIGIFDPTLRNEGWFDPTLRHEAWFDNDLLEGLPLPPTTVAPVCVGSGAFIAKWTGVLGATEYRLDVSTASDFSTFVTDYENRNVGLVIKFRVTGLTASTTHYYRVRAVSSGDTSGNSDTRTVTTAAVWNPHDVAGLVVFLKADSLSLSDGDPVTTWTDSSDNGRDAVQDTAAAKPVYKTGIANGQPGLLYDAVDDFMDGQGTIPTVGSMFVVTKLTAALTDYKGLVTEQNDNGGVSAYFVAEAASSSWYSPAIWFNTFYRNTVAENVVSTTTNSIALYGGTDVTPNAGATNLRYGLDRQHSGLNRFWPGYIFEVVTYDTVLSTNDRQAVENYLNNKYTYLRVTGTSSARATHTTSTTVAKPAAAHSIARAADYTTSTTVARAGGAWSNPRSTPSTASTSQSKALGASSRGNTSTYVLTAVARPLGAYSAGRSNGYQTASLITSRAVGAYSASKSSTWAVSAKSGVLGGASWGEGNTWAASLVGRAVGAYSLGKASDTGVLSATRAVGAYSLGKAVDTVGAAGVTKPTLGGYSLGAARAYSTTAVSRGAYGYSTADTNDYGTASVARPLFGVSTANSRDTISGLSKAFGAGAVSTGKSSDWVGQPAIAKAVGGASQAEASGWVIVEVGIPLVSAGGYSLGRSTGYVQASRTVRVVGFSLGDTTIWYAPPPHIELYYEVIDYFSPEAWGKREVVYPQDVEIYRANGEVISADSSIVRPTQSVIHRK